MNFSVEILAFRHIASMVTTTDITNIEIVVNGKRLFVPAEISVAELLERLEIQRRAIAVEINQQIQPAEGFALRRLQHEDTLELVTLVGGG